MKYKLIFTFLFIGSLLTILYIRHNNKLADWETFEKTSEDKIKHHITTKTELKKINGDKKKTRSPASLTKKRIIIGKENIEKVKTFINTPTKNWKEKLGHNLLNHRRQGTKVFVKEVSGNIKIENGIGRYVEKVIVTTITAEGKQFSFNALADSQSGQVLATWNRTIHENFGSKPNQGMSAAPIY